MKNPSWGFFFSFRALQLHPNQAGLYIIAASHELDHLSPSAARTLLQRGIRMNPESIDIWREYVRMELGFIESLRRRWDVLGISLMGTAQSKKGKDPVDPSEHIQIGGGSSERFASEGDGQEEEDAGVPTPSSRGRKEDDGNEFGGLDGDEGAAARRQIMQGGIVKSVMTSAAEGMCVCACVCALPRPPWDLGPPLPFVLVPGAYRFK